MGKVKVTLSLDEDLVKRVKARVALEGRTLSEAVESSLLEIDNMNLLMALIDVLNLDKTTCSYNDVVRDRPKGLNAASLVRGIRDEREKNIS